MRSALAILVLTAPILALAELPQSLSLTSSGAKSATQDKEKKKRKGIGIGVDVSAFWPSDKDIQRAFSSMTLAVGLSPTNIYYRPGTRFIWDLNMNADSQAGSRYFTIAPTFGVIYSPRQESESSFRPYATVRVGPSYSDYSILRNATRFKDRKFGWNANAEVGMFLNDKFRVSLRYDKFSEHDGFDLGGLRAGVTWQFLRF